MLGMAVFNTKDVRQDLLLGSVTDTRLAIVGTRALVYKGVNDHVFTIQIISLAIPN